MYLPYSVLPVLASNLDFPGVTESSALTRFFAEQGLKFKIRKGSVYYLLNQERETATEAEKRCCGV
jgi:Velvet factor